MAEAEDNHNRKPSLRACGATQHWITPEEAIEWIAFRGRPFEPQRPDEPDNPELWRHLRAYRRKWAEEAELMPAFQAGKLALLWRLARDLLAEPQNVHPSALCDLRYVDQVRRAPLGAPHRRIRADLEIVLFVDEARVQELWPPKATDPTAPTLAEPPQSTSFIARRGHVAEEYERIAAWLPTWSGFSEKRVASIWRKDALAAARQADELKGIKLSHRLLEDVIRQDPGRLQKRQRGS